MEVNYKEIDTSKLKKDKVETKDVPGNAGRYSYAKSSTTLEMIGLRYPAHLLLGGL